jgi:flagellar hook-length control protein FliK
VVDEPAADQHEPEDSQTNGLPAVRADDAAEEPKAEDAATDANATVAADATALLQATAAESPLQNPGASDTTAAAEPSAAPDGDASDAAARAAGPVARAAAQSQARPAVRPATNAAKGDADGDAQAEAGADAGLGLPTQGVPAGFDAAQSIEAFDPISDASAAKTSAHAGTADAVDALGARAAGELTPSSPGKLPATAAADRAQQAPPTPEARFAEDNHPGIVTGIRGQLLPTGGTMHIRLDPPELGPLAVTVRLRNGTVEASFETSSDEAAKLLSHSLSSLKTSLESQGVNVERLHVSQAPKSQDSNQSGGNGDQQQQARDPQQEHAARQEHQRREMLRKLWAKLRGVDDPLDMVA